jgi:PAS domain S-box-containing protein
MRIKTKFLAVMLPIFILIIGTIIATYVVTAKKRLTETIEHELTFLTSEKSNQIAHHINDLISLAESLGRLPNFIDAVIDANKMYSGRNEKEIRNSIQKIDRAWIENKGKTAEADAIVNNPLSKFLRHYKGSNPTYGEIFVTDLHGATVAMTKVLSDYDQADEQWWSDTLRTGRPFLDDRGTDDSVKMIVLGAVIPISHEGATIGLLKVNFKVRDIIDIVSSNSLNMDESIVLVESHGNLLARTENRKRSGLSEIEKRVLTGGEGNSGTIHNIHNDTQTIMAFSQIGAQINRRILPPGAKKGISGEKWVPTTWHLFVEVDQEKVYAPINKLVYNFFIIGVVLLTLLMTSSFLFARQLLRPIAKLTDGVERIGKGELAFRINLNSNDEFGQLGNAFDGMALKLQGSLDSLKKSEERFKLSLNFSAVGSWDWDMKTGQLYWSENITPLFGGIEGYSDICYESFMQAIHPDDREKVQKEVETSIEDGKPYEVEYRVVWQDGTIRWILECGDMLRDKDGKAQHKLGVVQEITSRKKSEEELQQHSLAVKQSPVSVVITDIKGQIEYVNPKFEEVTGYSFAEVVGQNPRLLKSGKHDNTFYEELWKTVLKGEEWHGEICNRRKNGEEFWESASISSLKSSDGLITHFVAVKENITEKKIMKMAAERAEAATKAKSDFLANMSHEIRTPMNAVLNMSRLALETDLSPKQRNYILKSTQSAEALLGIINDILDFSKVEAGMLEIESINFNLYEVLDRVSSIIGLKTHEKKLELIYDFEPKIRNHLIGDPMRLTQVIVNLANNAIKFTKEGEIIIQLRTLDVDDKTVQLQVAVKDTGIGIEPEKQKAIFKSFTQADSSISRRYGGTGMGLAISTSLVEIMGGEIGMESEPGKGSTFHFTTTFGVWNQDNQEEFRVPDDVSSIRILMVDDNDRARQSSCQILQGFNFQVGEATTGAEALDELLAAEASNRPYQLVLMDLQMPEMDGVTATRAIKESALLENPPVIIMLSTYDVDTISNELDDIGLKGMLIKPVTPSTLLDSILNLFGYNTGLRHSHRVKAQSVSDAEEKLRGAKILVAEDNEINQEVVMDLLGAVGLIIVTANDGQEALDILQRESFDGVLMDIQMPEMDGFTATQAIRKQERFKDLPIIAMTANAMVGDREKAMEAGMNDHIAKPIDPETMLVTMAKWITPAAPSQKLITSTDMAEESKALPELECLDREAGLAICRGNSTLYQKLLIKFIKNHQNFVDHFNAARKQNDEVAATRHAHTLKGVAGTIGAVRLEAAAATLESDCRNNAPEKILKKKLKKVEKELSSLITALQHIEGKSEPDSIKVEGELDLKTLKPLLNELFGLLDDDDTFAVDKVMEIRQQLGKGLHEASLEELEKMIGEYDFEKALKSAHRFAQNVGLDMERSDA